MPSLLRMLLAISMFGVLAAGCAGTVPDRDAALDRFDAGREAYLAGEYSDAFELLLSAAQNGNSDAQYTIGYMYYEGLGVNRDENAALRWIRQSAESGNRRAVEALGQLAGMRAREHTDDAPPEPEADSGE